MRYTGNDGVVLVGASALGNVRSFDITEGGNEIDVPAMGDTARQRLPGKPDVSGSIQCWFDDGDTVQPTIAQGDSVALKLQPRGTGTGLPQFSYPTARITSINWRFAVDAGAECTFSFVSDDIADQTAQA